VAVQSQLLRILGSPHFDASPRNRKFLSYVVEETLAGRTARIKAYTIATSVFGRDERFDPQIDSVVRNEAGRLRRSLERYYLTDGRSDPLRIDIPRGSYVPVFGVQRPERQPETLRGPPTILVTPFEEEGDQSAFPSFTRGFARVLIIALTRFASLRVYGAESILRHPPDADPQALHNELGVDYILTGGTTLGPDQFEVDVILIEARTGRTIWADAFVRHLNPTEFVTLRNEVANTVARTIAQPFGIIQSERAPDVDGALPSEFRSYHAVLAFHRYWRSFDRSLIEEVRLGLERAVAAQPEFAEALACLSLVYANAFRFRHSIGATDLEPLERALVLARRAVEYAPGSSWAHYALGLALWFTGDVRGSIEKLEAGRALNPNDSTLIADLGQRYAMRGQWEKALAEARRVDAPHVLYGHVGVASAAGMLGRRAEAKAAVAAILAIDPQYGTHVVADLESRSLAPDLVGLVVDGLAAAGLPVEPRTGGDPALRRSEGA
jgi:adenylate cyclase